MQCPQCNNPTNMIEIEEFGACRECQSSYFDWNEEPHIDEIDNGDDYDWGDDDDSDYPYYDYDDDGRFDDDPNPYY